MTVTSQIIGDIQWAWMNRLRMRWGWPRSGMMRRAAVAIVTAASTTASLTIGANCLTSNSRPAEATIRPPAERPTKNMNVMM